MQIKINSTIRARRTQLTSSRFARLISGTLRLREINLRVASFFSPDARTPESEHVIVCERVSNTRSL